MRRVGRSRTTTRCTLARDRRCEKVGVSDWPRSIRRTAYDASEFDPPSPKKPAAWNAAMRKASWAGEAAARRASRCIAACCAQNAHRSGTLTDLVRDMRRREAWTRVRATKRPQISVCLACITSEARLTRPPILVPFALSFDHLQKAPRTAADPISRPRQRFGIVQVQLVQRRYERSLPLLRHRAPPVCRQTDQSLPDGDDGERGKRRRLGDCLPDGRSRASECSRCLCESFEGRREGY